MADNFPPGPWNVEVKRLKARDGFSLPEDRVFVYSGDVCVCEVPGGKSPRTLATASAIAAMPELHHALGRLLACHNPDGRFEPHANKEPLRLAKEALAKATA